MVINAAEIIDNKVTRIIVARDIAWCENALGGQWLDVTDTRCGRGYDYIDGELRPPQPYDSWTWYDGKWNPPAQMPDDGGYYAWDEDNQEWVDTEEEL